MLLLMFSASLLLLPFRYADTRYSAPPLFIDLLLPAATTTSCAYAVTGLRYVFFACRFRMLRDATPYAPCLPEALRLPPLLSAHIAAAAD